METPSLQTNPAPLPETNVTVQVDSNETAVEERTEAILTKLKQHVRRHKISPRQAWRYKEMFR